MANARKTGSYNGNSNKLRNCERSVQSEQQGRTQLAAPPRLLRAAEVAKRMGLGRTSYYARVARGLFPPPIRLGLRARAWLESEVNAVIEATAADVGEDGLRTLARSLEMARGARR